MNPKHDRTLDRQILDQEWSSVYKNDSLTCGYLLHVNRDHTHTLEGGKVSALDMLPRAHCMSSRKCLAPTVTIPPNATPTVTIPPNATPTVTILPNATLAARTH